MGDAARIPRLAEEFELTSLDITPFQGFILSRIDGRTSLQDIADSTGATKEQVRADNAACRAEADAVAGRDANITRDIRVGESRSASDAQRLLRQTRDVGDEARYDRIFAACMKARGYSLKK